MGQSSALHKKVAGLNGGPWMKYNDLRSWTRLCYDESVLLLEHPTTKTLNRFYLAQ